MEKINSTMIEDKDTNLVYISDTLKSNKKDVYGRLTSLLKEMGIDCKELPGTKDIWARDFMPIQLDTNDFLLYQYNPDYLQEERCKEFITDSRSICKKLGINYRDTDIILDGGNVVLCGDVVVMTDKVFAENNVEKNNPDLIKELKNIFGCPVIFIPWKKYCGDKYGHADGFIKYAGGKNILLTDKSAAHADDYAEIKRILTKNGFNVTALTFENHSQYDWAYINFLQVKDKIIMPAFGVDNDEVAKKQIESAFHYCSVHMIDMKHIVKDKGALHCITWNIKTQ